MALPTIVLQSKAPATIKKYGVRWKKWTASKAGSPVPKLPDYSKSKTNAPVEEAVNALSWVHQVAVVEDPTDGNR